MEINNYKWYTCLSYYSFFWFILFKLGLININPTPIYLVIVLYLIIQIVNFIISILKKIFKGKDENDKRKLNSKILLLFLILLLITDIIPLFFIPYYVDKYNILFSLLIIFTYLLFMKYYNINVWIHYFDLGSKFYHSNKLTYKKLLETMF